MQILQIVAKPSISLYCHTANTNQELAIPPFAKSLWFLLYQDTVVCFFLCCRERLLCAWWPVSVWSWCWSCRSG